MLGRLYEGQICSAAIDPVVERLARVVDDAATDGGLRSMLAAVADPRSARGVRHRMVVIMAVGGHTNIAAALRHYAWNPPAVITLLLTS